MDMLLKPKVVGVGEDAAGARRPVLDGGSVFKLMDQEGLPLPVLQMFMEERRLAFDVLGFCRAAKASGNYSPGKVGAILLEGVSKTHDRELYHSVVVSILTAFGEGGDDAQT